MSRYYLEEIRQTLAAYDQSRSLLLFPDGTSLSKLSEIDQKVLSKITRTQEEQTNQKITIEDKKYSYYLSTNSKIRNSNDFLFSSFKIIRADK